ncbi:MAG: hypothetical protein AAF125_16575 [Chloroflexota bacterium]
MTAFFRVLWGWGCLCLVTTTLVPLGAFYSQYGDVVAFQRTTAAQNADIYVVDVITGLTINLTQHPDSDRLPAWSPDGEWLVYQSLQEQVQAPETLYRVPYRTGASPEPLLPMGVIGTLPDWSPDGCCIAFSAYDNNTFSNNTHILHLETGDVWNAVPTPGLNQLAVAWSPDGTQVAFAASDHDFTDRRVYLASVEVPADGDGTTPDIPPPLTDITGEGYFVTPMWTHDGATVFVVDTLPRREAADTLYRADAHAPVDLQPVVGSGDVNLPAISADGEWMVYSTQDSRDRNNEVLYISRIDGTDVRQLTRGRGGYVQDTAPVWRP